jgi:spore germination protein GerM
MTRERGVLQIGGGIVLLGLLAWGVTAGLNRLMRPEGAVADDGTAAPTESGIPRITATLYYATADGQGLIAVRREVPLADGVVPQARAILDTLLTEAPAPYVSPIPMGTTVRAFYVTDRGDAFVDLSPEVTTNHSGGSFAELVTVYAIVNAMTTNLPTIQRVQILIDGKEADTLAGHVDLRRPLTPDLALVQQQPVQ